MTTKAAESECTVILVDDHAMVREGIRAVVERDGRIQVLGEASDGREAQELLAKLKPDVVVMDIGMPNLNGVEATRKLVRDHPGTRVIGLSMHTDKRFVLAMFEAGAMGYVAKDSIADEIVRAIHAVSKGRKYISSDVTGPVIEGATRREPAVRTLRTAGNLAPREREVLQLLAEGKTSGEIAAELKLSTHTVDTHRRNIMKKTDTRSVAELTKLAIREGLTSL